MRKTVKLKKIGKYTGIMLLGLVALYIALALILYTIEVAPTRIKLLLQTLPTSGETIKERTVAFFTAIKESTLVQIFI